MLVLLCVGLTSNAQSYTRSGNTFISSTGERVKAEPVKQSLLGKTLKEKNILFIYLVQVLDL